MTKAIEGLKLFSLDDHQREEYEQRLKAMRDYKASLAAEFKQGEEVGIKKGEELGKREAVIQGLKIGLDAKTLHKMTKIPVAEIEKIRRDLGLA